MDRNKKRSGYVIVEEKKKEFVPLKYEEYLDAIREMGCNSVPMTFEEYEKFIKKEKG